jgi:predicted GIY-YIG superfamily endonuclease
VHYVYLARCADGTLYVGSTADLEDRLRRHNEGEGGQYTKWRRPVTLIFVEQFATLTKALQRERQIKRWTREKKLALAAGDLETLRTLAKRRKR